MRNMFRIATVVASLGALTPLAANAAVGLHMYQPSPLVTHAQASQASTAQNNHAPVHTAQAARTQRNG